MASDKGWRPRFAHLQWVGLAAWIALVVGSCSHDWDVWMPQGTFTGSGGSTPTTTFTFGGGGWGGGAIEGECPPNSSGAPELIRASSPQRIAVCIGRTEVTREQYEQFMNAVQAGGDGVGGGYDEVPVCSWNDVTGGDTSAIRPALDWPPLGVKLDYPVAFVDWCDALAFCMFHGQRLCGQVETGAAVQPTAYTNPTESEWFAACTSAGRFEFPYGDDYVAGLCRGDEPASGPAPAGSLLGCKTAAGVLDLSGNLWEWENSCVGETGESDSCRQRGGGYQTPQSGLSCAADSSNLRNATSVVVGFRCCADPVMDVTDAGTDATSDAADEDADTDSGSGGAG